MMGPITPTDTVFQVLAKEHRDLEARFAQLFEHAETDIEGARADYRELAAAILAHLHAEGAVLFPALARIAALDQILVGSRADHARVEADVLALDRPNLTTSEWLRALKRMHADLVRLIEREESHVYPAARRAMPPDEANHLAHALRRAEAHELLQSSQRTR
jgi:hypothetical protein